MQGPHGGRWSRRMVDGRWQMQGQGGRREQQRAAVDAEDVGRGSPKPTPACTPRTQRVGAQTQPLPDCAAAPSTLRPTGTTRAGGSGTSCSRAPSVRAHARAGTACPACPLTGCFAQTPAGTRTRRTRSRYAPRRRAAATRAAGGTPAAARTGTAVANRAGAGASAAGGTARARKERACRGSVNSANLTVRHALIHGQKERRESAPRRP